MSAFWTVIIVAVVFGVTAYIVGKAFESFGAALDAISSDASDARHPDPKVWSLDQPVLPKHVQSAQWNDSGFVVTTKPPETRFPHRPIY